MKMMKPTLYILMLAALLAGCERSLDTEGPDLEDLYGEFSVLDPFTLSQNKVDFAAGEKVHFTARFSKIIDWKLSIKGKASGAQRVFEGKSRQIDISNSEWAGETSLLPIFLVEECEAHLSVADDSLQFTEILTIEGVKSNEGFVVADFENGWNDQWLTFVQSGADMSFNITDSDPAAQGNFYYDMGGEVDWDWLIGMIEFPASAYGENTFPLSNNANDVYFNAMVYLPEGITNPVLLMQFREDENEDGEFDEESEDMYSLELKVSDLTSGWQLISLKYADLVALANGAPVEPNGNGNHEPDKLWRVSNLFLANPSSGYSQMYMDYVIFTEGAPLKP